MQIYVVDSLDRERIGQAKEEFQVVYSDRPVDFTMLMLERVLSSPSCFLSDHHQRAINAQQCHLGACEQTGHGESVNGF